MGGGAEKTNQINSNLIVRVLPGYWFLATDVQPAGIYLVNPDNTINGNSVSGSWGNGIVLDFQNFTRDSSAISGICPGGMLLSPLTTFQSNIAHSNKRYGLFIEQWIPNNINCFINRSAIFNTTSVSTIISQFTAFKNGVNGIYAEILGKISLTSVLLADNYIAGFEVNEVRTVPADFTTLSGIILGSSFNSETIMSNFTGVITPRSDGLKLSNVHFYNFTGNQYPIVTCS